MGVCRLALAPRRPALPYFILKFLGTTDDGRPFFIIDLLDEDELCFCVWNGDSYVAALAEARSLARYGVPLVDDVGGVQ